MRAAFVLITGWRFFLIKNLNGGYKDVQKSPYRFKFCGERKRD